MEGSSGPGTPKWQPVSRGPVLPRVSVQMSREHDKSRRCSGPSQHDDAEVSSLVPPPSLGTPPRSEPPLPELPPPVSLRVTPSSGHRRSRSAGSMKALTGMDSTSTTMTAVGTSSVSSSIASSSSSSSALRGSKKEISRVRKQQSTVGKLFTGVTRGPPSGSLKGLMDSDGLVAASAVDVELQIVLADGKQKVVTVKCLDLLPVRDVLELFVAKVSSSKLKKFFAAKNVLSADALALQLPSDPPIWLRGSVPIGRYCDLEGAPPPQLIADVPPLGGLPQGQLTARIMLEDGLNARLVDLDERQLVQDLIPRCAALLDANAAASELASSTWHLFCWQEEGRGFWLDSLAHLADYALPVGVKLELREPNFVVLTNIKHDRIVVDGLTSGESFLRQQLSRMKVSSNSLSYFSLFKEAGDNDQTLVELPTWQTIAKMGLQENQLIHLGRVEDADTPTSLAAFFVVTVALKGVDGSTSSAIEALDDEPHVASATTALSTPTSHVSSPLQQRDSRDWHSFLKLYVHEDILAKVDSTELVGGPTDGILCITNAGLVFKSDKTFLRIFHGMISKVEKVQVRQTKKKTAGAVVGGNNSGASGNGGALGGVMSGNNLSMLQIDCKDFESVCFVLPKHAPKNFLETLMMLAFPKETRQLYAFSYQLPASVAPNPLMPDGWKFYDPVAFHERMGVGTAGSEWCLSDINASYTLCDTYPAVLAFPVRCSQEALRSSASFRSRGRLPALSYLHRNGASITRCSQPKVGLIGGSSGGDQILLQAILEANPNKDQPLRLIDARPKLNAIANQAMGKGSERVFHYTFECTLEFANIDNIHVMRQSLVKLHEACRASRAGELDYAGYQNQLASSGWIAHVHKVLAASIKVAKYVGMDKQSVVLHCSDGWDRTAQLSSLSMMLLNGTFRTIRGFCELVEKEWLAFGHQFARRHGHCEGKMDQDGDSQRSPVFLQFLDCAWQLCNIYPVAFEFTGFFLSTLIDEVYNCRFGTFLYDCEQERSSIKNSTVSLWTYILSPSVVDLYRNPLYKPTPDALINDIQPHSMQLWAEYHCHSGRMREDHERVREMSMRIEMLEAQLAQQKKKAATVVEIKK